MSDLPRDIAGDHDRAPDEEPMPFAVTIPSLRPVPVVAGPVTDLYAWVAVTCTLAGALGLFLLPDQHLAPIGVVAWVAAAGALVADRMALVEARREAPGWWWVAAPPAYLFRRGRVLGVQPVHGYVLVATGVVVRVAIVLLGVGGVGGGLAGAIGGTPTTRTSSFEADLEARHREMWQQPASADCPRRVPLERDHEFVCVVLRADGDARFELTFRVVDDAGGVRQVRSSFSGRSSSPPPEHTLTP